MNVKIISGTNIATKLGINKVVIIVIVLNCPPIHNIVVVTSPIGDQAPPAFAATTTIPAKNQRSYLSSISFLKREIITIEVVKLSRAAEKKKVKTLIIHSNLTFLVVVILSVIIAKPSWASTNSTMVIAPKRKNKILEISLR